MIISERQAGVAEKGEGEVRLPPDAREALVRRLPERCEVGGGDVGRFPTFMEVMEVWTSSLNYAFESFRKKDWQTDTLNPFQPGVSAIWLGNDPKNYDAHIVGVTLGYKFE